MTIQEQEQVKRVCGRNYETSDIPTYIRNREDESVGELLEELFDNFSNEYPLGGVIEPYDIEREKDLTN